MGQQSRRTRAAKLPPAFYKRQTCRQRYWKGKIRCTTENPNRCIQEWVAIKPAVTLLAPEVFCVQFNTERGVPNGSVQLWTPIWAAEYVDFVSNEARVFHARRTAAIPLSHLCSSTNISVGGDCLGCLAGVRFDCSRYGSFTVFAALYLRFTAVLCGHRTAEKTAAWQHNCERGRAFVARKGKFHSAKNSLNDVLQKCTYWHLHRQ